MNNLTLKSCQEMLCRCIYGDTDEDHLRLVVPRQGNLMNPQQQAECAGYFTYYISRMRRALLNRTFDYDHIVSVVADIELQGVGVNAEEFIQQTMWWDERADVKAVMADYDTQLLNTDREIITVPYFQDGANTVLSHTTTLRVVSALSYGSEEAAQKFRQLLLLGKLIVRSE